MKIGYIAYIKIRKKLELIYIDKVELILNQFGSFIDKHGSFSQVLFIKMA